MLFEIEHTNTYSLSIHFSIMITVLKHKKLIEILFIFLHANAIYTGKELPKYKCIVTFIIEFLWHDFILFIINRCLHLLPDKTNNMCICWVPYPGKCFELWLMMPYVLTSGISCNAIVRLCLHKLYLVHAYIDRWHFLCYSLICFWVIYVLFFFSMLPYLDDKATFA